MLSGACVSAKRHDRIAAARNQERRQVLRGRATMPNDADNLSQGTTEPVFLVTTENPRGRSHRRALFVIFSVMGLLLIALGTLRGVTREAEGAGVGTRGESSFALAMEAAGIL